MLSINKTNIYNMGDLYKFSLRDTVISENTKKKELTLQKKFYKKN